MVYYETELYHHGILGQKWGKKNGPPYPLKVSAHSKSEKDANWRKSLGKENSYKKIKNYGEANKKHHENVMRIQNLDKSEYIKKSLLSHENDMYNKKISSIAKSNKNKRIAGKILAVSGGIALAAIVGYTIYENGINSEADEWLTNLSTSGSFGNAKLFTDKFAGAEYAKNVLFNKQWWNELSLHEKYSIKEYTGTGYMTMNKILRQPNSNGLSQGDLVYGTGLIKKCTDALKKASLPEDAIVHRGVGSLESLAKTIGIPPEILKSMDDAKKLIGMDFIDPAFGSSGASTKDAWAGVKLHMFLPKGSQAMYIDPVSSVPGEHEVLINRNARYMIKDIRFSSDGKVKDVFVELLEHAL